MKWLILLFGVLLSACSTQNKCVRVAYYDYGDVGCIQHIYQFQGTYYPGAIGNNKGIVLVDKYLGDGNFRMFEQCEDPADLVEGWYSVLISEGKGIWVLNGEGFGKNITVLPSVITQKALQGLTK